MSGVSTSRPQDALRAIDACAGAVHTGREPAAPTPADPGARGRPRPLRLAIVAGEASGDYLGAGLIAALRAAGLEVRAEGIGGAEMLAAGCRSYFPMERLAVMGLFEALARYPGILPLRARLARRLIADPPDVFVGVDAPDFNLALERRLRRSGIRTVHYVSPSVWAWRRYRLRKIARSADLMLTLFPFEASFYEQHRVPVEFVGHPLADQIPQGVERTAARRELGLPADGEVVALLPGSRTSEVKYLAEPLVGAARWLAARRRVRFVAPLVDGPTRRLFEAALGTVGAGVDIRLLEGRSRAAMAAADVVLLASGTASLEALLLGRPMVITYRTAAFTYHVMKALLQVPYVGLPNLLAGRELVPELLQERATPAALGAAVLALLEHPEQQRALAAEFACIGAELRRGASSRAAAAVRRLVQT